MEVLTRVALLLSTAAVLPAQSAFPIHTFHAQKLGRLDCNLCHVAAAKGSVELKRPGHDQCKLCHAAAFEKVPLEKTSGGPICDACHKAASRPGHVSVLIDFSHAKHMDPKARVNTLTGVRSDCGFCHKSSAAAPSHTQCAACHGQAGIKPELTTFLRTGGCRGCHAPEQIETGEPARLPAAIYPHIRFSHADHRSTPCTTCHYAIPRSASLVNASLPTMAGCAGCHETVNCRKCHLTGEFNRNIKPATHDEVFRLHHAEASAAPDAKCFACHQNIVPSAAAKDQCASCHLVTRPASHTARWRDDIHGKYAALDRTSCATCHAADYCSRCHNQLPASHVPLPIFKNGGHANLAALNERSCFTCHTFQNTCSTCHTQQLQPGNIIKRK